MAGKNAVANVLPPATRDRTSDLLIFSLTLSQLIFHGFKVPLPFEASMKSFLFLEEICSFCGWGSHVSICRHWIVWLFGEQMFLELSFCCFWMLKIFFLLPKICCKSCRKTRKGAGSSELEIFSRSLQQLSYLNCLVTLPIEPLQCFAACRSKFCIFLWFGS